MRYLGPLAATLPLCLLAGTPATSRAGKANATEVLISDMGRCTLPDASEAVSAARRRILLRHFSLCLPGAFVAERPSSHGVWQLVSQVVWQLSSQVVWHATSHCVSQPVYEGTSAVSLIWSPSRSCSTPVTLTTSPEK